MIPKRPHPTGSVAKQPSLKLVTAQRDRLSYPLPDNYAQIAAERLAADMVYSAICDILAHDPEPEPWEAVNAELRKLASEMLVRSRA